MKIGMFMTPYHPPERTLGEASKWDLEILTLLDELDYAEAWIGEHFTVPWEPIPSPDLLIAQALMQTKQIRFGAGVHLLPLHHPIELAHRVAYLDHLAEGRLNFGVGAGVYPSDFLLFGIDAANNQQREMATEALDIIVKLWTEDQFQFEGTYWSANKLGPILDGLMQHHILPYQKPHPPIGVAGVTPGSTTLHMAGARGYLPLSFAFTEGYITDHWQTIQAGAESTGREANRNEWRLVRDVIVAATEEDAQQLAYSEPMLRTLNELWLPLVRALGMTPLFKHDQSLPDEAVDAEYYIKHHWFVGSVDSVTEKIVSLHKLSGGFGTLLISAYDCSADPGPWRDSLRLLSQEVLPRVNQQIG